MSKKKVFGICGSASVQSSNYELLKTLSNVFLDDFDWIITNDLRDFQLFTPEDLEVELPSKVKDFKKQLLNADAIVIVTPEYTHNIPAVLKNALEWCTASGEFSNKPVLPITFTPSAPRGKYAMNSLLESLKTMDADIVTELSLYKTDVDFDEYAISLPKEINYLLGEALSLL